MHVSYTLDLVALPREAIEDCSRGGCDAGPAVQHWREVLNFTVNRDRAVRCLAGYGAWSDEELSTKGDDEIAETVLWLACCDFSEFLYYAELLGDYDPYEEDRPDDFDPPAGSDIYVLE